MLNPTQFLQRIFFKWTFWGPVFQVLKIIGSCFYLRGFFQLCLQRTGTCYKGSFWSWEFRRWKWKGIVRDNYSLRNKQCRIIQMFCIFELKKRWNVDNDSRASWKTFITTSSHKRGLSEAMQSMVTPCQPCASWSRQNVILLDQCFLKCVAFTNAKGLQKVVLHASCFTLLIRKHIFCAPLFPSSLKQNKLNIVNRAVLFHLCLKKR